MRNPARPAPRRASARRSRLARLFGAIAAAALASACSRAESAAASPGDAGLRRIVFAGGCFWCLEPPFEKLDGVRSVVSGFTGGQEKDPAYKDVAYGRTSHREAVRVTYDPDAISVRDLLATFWRQIDPTDDGGQFVDRGSQYRTGIYWFTERQKRIAEASREIVAESDLFDEPIVTPIEKADAFYRAKEFHQDFYKTHGSRYRRYRSGSGRDAFIERTWATRPDLFADWLAEAESRGADGD